MYRIITSKRLWGTIASICTTIFAGNAIGLTDEQITKIVWAIAALVIGDSVRPVGTKGTGITAPLFLMMLCGSSAFAQLDLEKTYSPYQPIVIKLKTPIPDGAKLTAIWEVPDASFREICSDTLHVWAKPGNYNVTATILVTKTILVDGQEIDALVPNTFQKYRSDFAVVAPGPPPDPDKPDVPDPGPIPEDEFDNIARRVDQWIKDTVPEANQFKRKELATVYLSAVVQLEKDSNVSAANKIVTEGRAKVLQPQSLADSWAIVGQRIGQDAGVRTWTSTVVLARYYKALAIGFGGAN